MTVRDQHITCSLYNSKTVTEKLNRDVEVESELAKSNNSSKQRAYRPRSWLDPSCESEIMSKNQQ